MKFRKRETIKFGNVLSAMREEMKDDDCCFWSRLVGFGVNDQDDIRRFTEYARQVKAMDIVNEILKQHPDY